ncbi:hypothetical protein B0H17DRAFT_1074047 [Mycena rosella]|uniref:Uncharacterized protein n=1 Tax=Mycena rosella TaxID=1033263 RepID=A0AAD7D7Y2_MYCRO|nr:hypothetical protein B0H17DRAFT_1074047 [Mycena rosella]
MHDRSKAPHYSPRSVGGIIGNWRSCTRLDGSEYYTRNTTVGPGDDSPLYSALVVDDLHLRTTADDLASTSTLFCEEIYFLRMDQWLIVFHSSQTAFYSSQQFVDIRTKRKLYWQYIATHPAHTGRSLAKWLPEAQRLALVYLKWCSFEALTSSTAKIPFPLKHSQDLANILTSLYQQVQWNAHSEVAETSVLMLGHSENPAVDPEGIPKTAATGAKARSLEAPEAGSSEPMDRALASSPDGTSEEDSEDERDSIEMAGDEPVPEEETAAQESCKLRTALIAKVLAEKYNQQGAEDNSSETDQPLETSKGLDTLFWVVDVASFGSFLRYVNRLEEVRATILTDDQWRDHILRLVKEWEEFNLISTVLLSASAGILALENIGGVPRTAILISILSSFGSVTTGLYCISMYQLRAPNSRDSVDRTNALTIFNYNQYTLKHKGIALILGLPMAFLVWSLVSFMVGILSFNVVGTENSGHVSGVAYAVVSVAAFVFLLIAIAFYSLSRLWGTGRGHGILNSIRRRYMDTLRHWRPRPSKAAA